MNIFLITCIILFPFITCLAQVSDKTEEAKDFRLTISKPSAYISFERYSVQKPYNEGESGTYVWLRFHNNTKWNLTVKVNGCRPEQEECGAFYEVLRLPNYKDKIKESEAPYGRIAHKSSIRTIKSGGSFLFSIPKESLAEGLYIAVDFSYEWEIHGNSGGGILEIRHQVGFFSWQLPKAK
ncbi:MAG TPA: hypothetical protein VF540_13480 [Segetibacter sp.]|jgi:hypothetical protein